MRWSHQPLRVKERPTTTDGVPAHLEGWEEFVRNLCREFPNHTAGEAEVRRERIHAYVGGNTCRHDFELVRVSFKSGTGFHLKRQCRRCKSASTALKMDHFTPAEVARAPERKPFDPRPWVLTLHARAAVLLGEERAPWEHRRDQYRTFLRGGEWENLRERVISRAGRLCEGCLTEPATQVHHTERHRDRPEMAWELRALCQRCHEIVEGIRPSHI